MDSIYVEVWYHVVFGFEVNLDILHTNSQLFRPASMAEWSKA